MTKKLSFSLFLIFFLALGVGLVYSIFKAFLPLPENSLAGSEENSFSITQAVDFAGAKPTVSENVTVQLGETSLAVLRRTHEVAVKEYSFGILVEGIDGIAGGTDGKYWIYYLNGTMATVGAGDYSAQPGDIISWRLEKGE